MNAFSAIAVATAVVCAYGVALQLGARRPLALLAVLWLAFAHTFWAHAIRAEAQDFALAFSAIAIYAIVRWLKGGATLGMRARSRLYGVALAAHPNAIWILPGFVLATIVAKRRPTLRVMLGSAALVVALA